MVVADEPNYQRVTRGSLEATLKGMADELKSAEADLLRREQMVTDARRRVSDLKKEIEVYSQTVEALKAAGVR